MISWLGYRSGDPRLIGREEARRRLDEWGEQFFMVARLAQWSRTRTIFTWIAMASIGGALIFTLGWLIAGRLQDHYNPRSDYISSLAAVGAVDAWIMILALVVFGLSVISLGAGLILSLNDTFGRIGSLGVLASGLGVMLVGIMRHDCGVQLPTCSFKVSMGEISGYHAVHDVVAATTFVVAGASQLLISRSAKRSEGWRHLRIPSAVSGGLTLGLFLLMSSPALVSWVGVLQRGIALVASLWVSALGVHLYWMRGRRRNALTSAAVHRADAGGGARSPAARV
ncbi:DUF998 domain-containing protein [Phytoactinopolyspora halotolerans]|uniref:DUF998 domain-containing protein n=1 Tax=Phytoactinopolyspora halotolerans TaxID=1981512 RepID=A0A6L9S8R9_9ACTN|nr:DUF998 domain-containing protein [Phytoactinopolyspora halotolerans]NEE01459.1 DUF998 domain-containing protein [Phytoactinopolyspora halotolerans]